MGLEFSDAYHSSQINTSQFNHRQENQSGPTRFLLLLRRHGKLSWPWCWLYTEMVYPFHPGNIPFDNDPTGSRTHNLAIARPTF